MYSNSSYILRNISERKDTESKGYISINYLKCVKKNDIVSPHVVKRVLLVQYLSVYIERNNSRRISSEVASLHYRMHNMFKLYYR